MANDLQPIEAHWETSPIIAQHHEWFNGTGHPMDLCQEQICIGAHFQAAADELDALFSGRPYRQSRAHHRVLAYIQPKSNRQFDPVVVRTFMKVHTAA